MSFPIQNGGSFHSYVNVYQRVIHVMIPLVQDVPSTPGELRPCEVAQEIRESWESWEGATEGATSPTSCRIHIRSLGPKWTQVIFFTYFVLKIGPNCFWIIEFIAYISTTGYLIGPFKGRLLVFPSKTIGLHINHWLLTIDHLKPTRSLASVEASALC